MDKTPGVKERESRGLDLKNHSLLDYLSGKYTVDVLVFILIIILLNSIGKTPHDDKLFNAIFGLIGFFTGQKIKKR